jgi:hypothetical protein
VPRLGVCANQAYGSAIRYSANLMLDEPPLIAKTQA